MCSPLGRATMNSLMKVATLRLEITVHSHSLTSRTEAGTSISRFSLTFTWHARRQCSLASLREMWTASVGSISPPPSTTFTRHWPQLPFPPQAEGRKTFCDAMVESRESPAGTLKDFSPLTVISTSPECTRKCLATRSTITSSRVMVRKMPTPVMIVVPASDAGMKIMFMILQIQSLMPRKLMKAIPIRAVMMKVMPTPRRGPGTFE